MVFYRTATSAAGTAWNPSIAVTSNGFVAGATSIALVNNIPTIAMQQSQQGWIYLRFGARASHAACWSADALVSFSPGADATGASLQTTLFLYDKGIGYQNLAASLAPPMAVLLLLLALVY